MKDRKVKGGKGMKEERNDREKGKGKELTNSRSKNNSRCS